MLTKKTLKRDFKDFKGGVNVPDSKRTSPFEDHVYFHHAPSTSKTTNWQQSKSWAVPDSEC